MIKLNRMVRPAAVAAVGVMVLAGCADAGQDEGAQSSQTTSETSAAASASGSEAGDSAGGHAHDPDGGRAPEGIEEASDPTYPVGTRVTLTADHMPGMAGSEATISGAFDTTTYSVNYTPTDGGEAVTDHKWVVHEELEDPGQAPLAEGTEVVLNAGHMEGMDGAEATIDSSTDETVYMVDVEMDGMTMTNHKWVVESEVEPAQ